MNLLEFIDMLAAGKFLIPTFQRYFVWEPASIIDLWDSIYHFYPIGSFLYWQTDVRLKIHRKLGGFIIPQNKNTAAEEQERSYILDGQQRATALVVSFFGGKESVNKPDSFDYTMYFDAVNAEFLFENEMYKRKWDVNPGFLIRLKDIQESGSDLLKHLSSVPGYNQSIEDNILKLLHAFKNYKASLICITGFDIAGVCKIFERINHAGKQLENFDIMVARSFQDNPIIVEET
jgi:uncharacterized protein with ParB-like and HNH nuclease domain